MAEPDPTEVAPWYLRNITQALALDESTGNVYVRTDADINIANANITVGNVGITSFGNIPISGNTLPVSGNINIASLPEVEIKNDVDNPIPVSRNTTENSVTNPIYVEGVNNASFFAPTQSDAFGRLRVSNPLTLFDTQNKYTDQGYFISNLVGGGTCTYNQPSNTFALAVTGSGSSVQRETTKTFVYQPGKSLFILNTFAMNTPTAGLTQSVGYYNDDNGIFFEADGTTLNMVIRSTSSGSTVETAIPQSNWNGDTLSGAGG